jgi:spermidine synthase
VADVGKRRLLLFAFGMSSVAALSYQVLWGRFLTFTFGTTVYAVSTILAVFMAGLALGSNVMGRYADRVRRPVALFAVMELAIGLCGALLLWALPRLYIPFFALYRLLGDSFHLFNLAQFLLALAVLLPPTFIMGATFPLSSRIYAQEPDTVGRDVGTLYSADTFGAIFGAFAGGFILIPLLGLDRAVMATIFINYGLAGLVYFRAREAGPARGGAFALSLAAAVAFSFVMLGQSERQTVSPYESLIWNKATKEEYLLAQEGWTLYKKDSAYGEVKVVQLGESVDLYIDGILNTGFNDPSYRLGFYPMLLHDAPKRVMNVGYGGGYAIQAQEKFPVERIVCLEINPYVVEGAKLLREDTEYALDDPRLQVIIGDGRNYLASVREDFDVIFCEVGNIWISGTSPVFTREWLQTVRRRLAPGGIYAQDLQFWEMSPQDLRIHLNTFRSVFPYVLIAEYNTEAVVMGATQPIAFDRRKLAARLAEPRIRDGLARAKVTSVDVLLQHLVADSRRVEEVTRGTTVMNTDDRPVLEFSTPRNVGSPERNAQETLRMLRGEGRQQY